MEYGSHYLSLSHTEEHLNLCALHNPHRSRVPSDHLRLRGLQYLREILLFTLEILGNIHQCSRQTMAHSREERQIGTVLKAGITCQGYQTEQDPNIHIVG